MRAAVVTSFASPLELQDLPTPSPGIGQVLVRIEAVACATPTSTPRGVTGR
jgi:Zn-dependent alcohol dehydrogenases